MEWGEDGVASAAETAALRVSFRQKVVCHKLDHPNVLLGSSLFPFLYFMARDFNVAKTKADISSYAGYVGSSFVLGKL